MRSNLFWLNDEQWQKIEPFLPTDVRGKERVDDRRVISDKGSHATSGLPPLDRLQGCRAVPLRPKQSGANNSEAITASDQSREIVQVGP